MLSFTSWVSTDRTTLEVITKEVDDFIELFLEDLKKLKLHDMISKLQTRHFQDVKTNLKPGELLIGGDFAENYTPVVQDAVQSHHWNKQATTIHPWIVYYVGQDEQVQSLSIAMISDRIIHDPGSVNLFMKELIHHLKSDHNLVIDKIYYFSVGCPNQYKCRQNFINLLYHQQDFGIIAEWNFFATSHGKGPYDGIGGVIKRRASQESLRRTLYDQIQTPQDLHKFCEEKISGIKTIFVSKDEIVEHIEVLKGRFANAKTLVGTKKFHHFKPIPCDPKNLECKVFSSSEKCFVRPLMY